MGKFRLDDLKIQFPRTVSIDEARILLRHITISLTGNPTINITAQRHEKFGDEFAEKKESTLGEVAVSLEGESLRGTIRRHADLNAADFQLVSDYEDGGKERAVYTAMEFQVTPGYEPGELISDDAEIMQETRQAIARYFELHK